MRRIGRIAIEFGHLEWQVGNVFKELIGSDIGDMIAEVVDTFNKRCSLSVKLMKERFPNLADDWKQCMDEAAMLAQKRNAVLHSAWLFQDGQSMIGMHAKGTSEAYPIVELDKIADRIHDLSVRVGQLSGPVIASSMPDEQSLEGT